jgi:hypothetical protein
VAKPAHYLGYRDAVTLRRATVVLVAVLTLTAACSSQLPETTTHPSASRLRAVNVLMPPPIKPLFGHRRDGRTFRTSHLVPKPVHQKPYQDKLLSEHILPAPVDKDGVRAFELDGKSYYHPVGIAQYALAKLDVAQRTGSKAALKAAKVNAAKLIEISHVHRGGMYFPYPFDFALGGFKKQTIHSPWWSAMAQGQALSLFVRLYNTTGKQSWRDAADKTFATLDDRGPRTQGPWDVYVDHNHYLWFEEYAGDTKPLLVLNGDMFAIFGVWDYYRLTHSAHAKTLFNAGTTTLREYLPLFRADSGAAYYCLRAPFCQQPAWQNKKYHGIVIKQMRIIADMTDDPWFSREADRYEADFSDYPR